MVEKTTTRRERVNLDLSEELSSKLDRLKKKYGQTTRAGVLRILIAMEKEN